jgi:molecular chaperone HtpG
MAAREKPVSVPIGEIVIGRDVLELVSSAMYIDPMTIYREYVQNAADAIDEARASGVILPEEVGRVDIRIDPAKRSIKITDNGIGIGSEHFSKRLTALGASAKRGSSARGFRGVGRLAGLGYAQELIFRSRTEQQDFVTELVWDCRKLKALLRQADDGDIASLITEVATLRHLTTGDFPKRFFEVELLGVVRLRSDKLMSPTAVGDYLSQVAPVPFHPDFRFAAEVTSALSHVVKLGNLNIHVDDNITPLHRPHGDRFVGEDGREISFDELDVVEILGMDGEIAAIAWVLHHDYEGALPNSALIKGFRLRSGNVQIGDHALLEELFAEPRFNSWAVGEIHVVDSKILPNGRRDHFEQNAHYNNLTNQLAPLAREVVRRCRTYSVKRKWLREFEMQHDSVREALEISHQGTLGETERSRLFVATNDTIQRMARIADMTVLEEAEKQTARDTVQALQVAVEQATIDGRTVAEPLLQIPEVERKAYLHFFELVYECSANRQAAKSLIDRILLRVSSH